MTPVQSSSIERLIKDMWAELEASKNNQAPKSRGGQKESEDRLMRKVQSYSGYWNLSDY